MLIVLGGLPGAGKTSPARAFSRVSLAVHVRIDWIEQAIRESGVTTVDQAVASLRVAVASQAF